MRSWIGPNEPTCTRPKVGRSYTGSPTSSGTQVSARLEGVAGRRHLVPPALASGSSEQLQELVLHLPGKYDPIGSRAIFGHGRCSRSNSAMMSPMDGPGGLCRPPHLGDLLFGRRDERFERLGQRQEDRPQFLPSCGQGGDGGLQFGDQAGEMFGGRPRGDWRQSGRPLLAEAQEFGERLLLGPLGGVREGLNAPARRSAGQESRPSGEGPGRNGVNRRTWPRASATAAPVPRPGPTALRPNRSGPAVVAVRRRVGAVSRAGIGRGRVFGHGSPSAGSPVQFYRLLPSLNPHVSQNMFNPRLPE